MPQTGEADLSRRAVPQHVVVPREGGASSTPQPFDLSTDASGILDRPPSRTMTAEGVVRVFKQQRAKRLKSPRPALRGERSKICGTRISGERLYPRAPNSRIELLTPPSPREERGEGNERPGRGRSKTHLRILAARCVRAVQKCALEKFSGRREDRALSAPAAACALVESTRVRNHGFAETSGLPCAMVLTVYFALSLVTGLFCHHHP
jgi:hypothetical protein